MIKTLEILMATHDLELLAHETANAARRKKRDAFQAKWGHYYKCSKCGGPMCDPWMEPQPSPCHDALVISNGYAPPPEPK